jgi:site-specific DNA-methyltransferase (cytosine-N4-specific)
MRNRIDQGGETSTRRRPSGHFINKQAFEKDNGGSIPHNLLIASNSQSNDTYQTRCRAAGLPIHPARFPASLPRLFIKFLTQPNDIVYDPMSGSGTVAQVAEELGRQWIISEQSLTYLQGAALRFQDTPGLQTHFHTLAA